MPSRPSDAVKGTNEGAVEGTILADAEPSGTEPARAPDPLLGQVVAERYRVEALLGEGGMGAVYRAVHVHMRKVIALKVLHRQMTCIPEAVARFEREAIAAARIAHPNVANATDFGRLADGSFYLALEFVEGASLRDLIERSAPLPLGRTVNILRQIAEALDAAHEQGVVHRDLKPENVMLLHKGQDIVKVLDFGIAKVSDNQSEATHLTQIGAVFGTPDYMSPEQAGGKVVDHRSDLYALGVLAYEMLTGRTPFAGTSIAVVLTKHLTEEPPPLPDDVDPRLGALTMRLLAKSPAERPASARALIDELVRTRLSVAPVPAKQKPLADLARRVLPLWRRASDAARSAARRLSALARPLLERLRARVVQRVPALAVLDRRVRLAKLQVTLWWLVALAPLVLSCLLVLWLTAGEEAPEVPAVLASATVMPEPPTVEAKAPPQKQRPVELQDILALPVHQRTLADWLTMGRLHRELDEWPESIAAYRNALQLDRKVAKNPEVLRAVREGAARRSSHEAALNIAVNLLGEPGLDLVYDLWRETKDDPAQRRIAEAAYKKLEILRLRRASKALRVRLDLEFLGTSDCEAIKKTVEAAIEHADQRSVAALEALKRTDGCAASGTRDCYPCLRGSDDLEAALRTARGTPEPTFARGEPSPSP